MNVLVTRCPTCGTAFRALPAQLSAHSGMVRCGKCSAIFDALAHLVDESVDAPPSEPSPQLGLFDAGSRPGGPGTRPRPTLRRAPARDDEALPEFLEDQVQRPSFRAVWALGTLLALAALLAQLTYQYRTELATLVPRARPALVEGCRLVDCEVGLPRRPDLLSIESSDLQTDKRRDSLIVLRAVIRNRASFAQELPAIELTLTDASERALVRRVLRPSDYLPERTPALLEQGIGPGAEAALRLYFDTGSVRAAGYRLYVFFPA